MIIPVKLNARLLTKRYSYRLKNRSPVLALKDTANKLGFRYNVEVIATPANVTSFETLYKLYPTEILKINSVRVYIQPWKQGIKDTTDALLRTEDWSAPKLQRALYSWMCFYIATKLSKEFPFEQFVAKAYSGSSALDTAWCLVENGEIILPKKYNSKIEFLYDRYGIFCLAPRVIRENWIDPKSIEPIRKYFEELSSPNQKYSYLGTTDSTTYTIKIQQFGGDYKTIEVPVNGITATYINTTG